MMMLMVIIMTITDPQLRIAIIKTKNAKNDILLVIVSGELSLGPDVVVVPIWKGWISQASSQQRGTFFGQEQGPHESNCPPSSSVRSSLCYNVV